MRTRYQKNAGTAKIAVMALLLTLSCGLTYYFHVKLETGTVFTHYFYVPIILACIWWKRRGLVVPVFLAAMLIFSHYAVRSPLVSVNDYIRAVMFIAIGIVVAVMSERIASQQERAKHLTAVLRAIRNVNQLIVREKDRGRLLQGACDNLIETRGYHHVWIVLLDKAGGFVTAAEGGLGARFESMIERLQSMDLPRCGRKALEQSGVVVTADTLSECTDCPLSGVYNGGSGMAVRMEYGGVIYGLLSVSIPAELAEDAEEQNLLREIAGDIAFALYDIELIRQHELAEKSLRENEKKLSQIVEGSPIPTFVIDKEHTVTHWNNACEYLTGILASEMVGVKKQWSAFYPDERPVMADLVVDELSGEEISRYYGYKYKKSGLIKGAYEAEHFFPTLGDSGKWLFFTATPLRDYQEKVIGAIETLQDVTDRKQAEELLRENENRLRLIMENAFDGINIVEYDSKTYRRRLVMRNDSYVEMSGRSREELMAADDLKRFVRDIECYGQPFHEQILKGLPVSGMSCWLRPDGRENYYEWTATPLKVGDKYHIIGIDRDITDRKRAEEALRQSGEQYRAIFESATDALLIFDLDGIVVEANPAACAAYGYSHEKIIGLSGKDIVHPESYHLFGDFKEQVKTTGHFFTESVNVRKDGSTFNVEIRGTSFTFKGKPHLMSLVRDISKRRQAEEEKVKLEAQLRQSVKMEAIGRLAGGIAHDFNNMLAIIQGYADLLLKSMSKDDDHRYDVQSIRTAAKRAAALTRQLLAFGRKQTIQPRVMDLNEVIADTDSMLRRIIGEDIELLTIPGKDIWNVKIDPDQMEEQVILNLAVNAREAMPDGGKLTIETSNVTFDADYERRHAEVTPGDFVMLAVSDTGTGMTEEIMPHIFEPFFTAGGTGKGTGLGLSTVYGIVKQSGGYIWVYSEPGKGTTFKIYLPRVDAPVENMRREYEPDILPRGTETVMVVEDESSVREIACRILREQGYAVMEAADGREALRAAEGFTGGEIHMLITDVIMPHMNGKELTDRIKTVHPNIKVLYTSGYTDNAIVHHGVLDEGVNFLAKPFPFRQLARTVRRVLDTNI
ncbi:MAG: PAS domain S-box protein [Phycisphaerae bacterium]|nr:PAS domain S-box protein [Phycisphaerae bacterium]